MRWHREHLTTGLESHRRLSWREHVSMWTDVKYAWRLWSMFKQTSVTSTCLEENWPYSQSGVCLPWKCYWMNGSWLRVLGQKTNVTHLPRWHHTAKEIPLHDENSLKLLLTSYPIHRGLYTGWLKTHEADHS